MVNQKSIERITNFLKISYGLKRERRIGWITKASINRPESVADHVFGTALISMIIGDLKGLNTCKIIRMALIHDLAEALIGDKSPIEKDKLVEDEIFRKICSQLPSDLGKSYKELWNELSNKKTAESKLFKEIDKLEIAVQAFEYCKEGYSKDNLSDLVNSSRKALKDPLIIQIFDQLRH